MMTYILRALLALSALFITAQAIWNSIIPGFNPDPALLRVDGDYYIATSSFEYWPGMPIYHSETCQSSVGRQHGTRPADLERLGKDLSNWTLISHALTRPEQLQLYGVPTGAGAWAPSLAHFKGKFWLSGMTRWTYDPVARVWPRVWFVSSADLVKWSDLGIDPELFHDEQTGKTYLNLMAPNNNTDRLWGISQCEVSLSSGDCVGEYRSLWNGTLKQDTTARPEGPRCFGGRVGGTDELHRASIARGTSPSGPSEPCPHNPLMYNGQWRAKNLTVQSTGHATFVEAADGAWYASFIARRNVNGSSSLGRETFLAEVTWEDDWPIINRGKPVLLSEEIGPRMGLKPTPAPWRDEFSGKELDPAWSLLRPPYSKTYDIHNGRLVFKPNVFGLSDREHPAAVLRKQTSLNMTFSADVLASKGTLGPRNRVGVSAYLSEFQHQDIGVRGCVNATGICLYAEVRRNTTVDYWQRPLNASGAIPGGLKLHIRTEPLVYRLEYSFGGGEPTYVAEVDSRWQAFAPAGYFVFTGASFALFATGEGEPWPVGASEVGFTRVEERYYEDGVGDYDRW
ncbi:beta-xylosidase (glycosyl hydrolase family 43 protein) [Colletotrichum tofieldiae]|uniref:Beta-xylosidase (Glycosyl hydrolase family 43 protein) n=1 Tax=Colletotrichum tofieldiae TaxID=708197 RepID=A0A166TCN8_9PEZI|nr:beta-xylosidase (glycosyl hydrolase family 43 protein) [Colletotrichum tofieldiae]